MHEDMYYWKTCGDGHIYHGNICLIESLFLYESFLPTEFLDGHSYL